MTRISSMYAFRSHVGRKDLGNRNLFSMYHVFDDLIWHSDQLDAKLDDSEVPRGGTSCKLYNCDVNCNILGELSNALQWLSY